jgi:hypothetical protein
MPEAGKKRFLEPKSEVKYQGESANFEDYSFFFFACSSLEESFVPDFRCRTLNAAGFRT